MREITLSEYCNRGITDLAQYETAQAEYQRGVHQTWRAIRVGDVRALRAYKRKKTVAQGNPQLMETCVENMGRYTSNERDRRTTNHLHPQKTKWVTAKLTDSTPEELLRRTQESTQRLDYNPRIQVRNARNRQTLENSSTKTTDHAYENPNGEWCGEKPQQRRTTKTNN